MDADDLKKLYEKYKAEQKRSKAIEIRKFNLKNKFNKKWKPILPTCILEKVELIEEYYEIKVGDSKNIRIQKVAYHKQKWMPDHGICQKLSEQFDPKKKVIKISSNSIPNVKLFENLLKFSFTELSELKIARYEYKDLEKICIDFNLKIFMHFVTREFQRIDFSSW